MTFGLKNAGATYQRAMNYIFHELIDKIVEIYIDDVVIKSLDHESHLDDVRKTLECTRKHGLKMNPNKCAFGVSVTTRISANGNPTLCTSVIVPGRCYHVQSLSQVVQIHTTRE
jgi:hypothetical protein